MVAQLHDAAMDAAYDYVDQSIEARVITAYAADDTYATITGGTITLANATMIADSDYTKADGDAGARSRKVTMAVKNGVSVANSGSATHVALCVPTGSTVRLVTTCTPQSLTSGNTVNIPAWKHEFGQPT